MEGSDQANNNKIKEQDTLPPGFRFHPTDEELITYYLVSKISDTNFTARAITDVDLNKCEPWDLPGKAKMGEKEWYFFSLRDRKYPTGVRTNRATNTGYWKTTGKDKEIYNSVTTELVGMKKTLVFYRGRAPRGEKSNWVMHEYRIHAKSSFRTTKKDEWVVCRVFQKSAGAKKYPSNNSSRTMNIPYNLNEIGPSHVIPPQMLQPDNFNNHFSMGRNYIMANAELAELTRSFRQSATGPSLSNPMNMPMTPQMGSYPIGGPNCFTISGLNLNLGGSVSNPILRAMPQSHHNPVMDQHDVIGPPMMSMADASGYGCSTSNAGMGGVEHCMDLDNYWPSY